MKKPAFSIYNASAGSGKTYTLVKEYLKIILTSRKDDAYKNILAITFTNKAVHEMKSRIVDSLFDFTKGNPSDKSISLMKDISIDTGLDLYKITEKSKAIIKNIIHNYAAFDISTIDKFTHKVIRSFAHDLDLPVNFDVSLDTENLLQEAVDAIIAQAGEDEVLTKLLVDFTMEKTDDDKSWDISSEIFTTGKLILNENYREEVISLKEKQIPEFVALKRKLQELCKDIDDESADLASQIINRIDSSGIDVKSFSAGHFPNHLKSIQEERFNPNNKTYHEPDDIKINKTAKDRSLIEGIIPQMLADLHLIYKKMEKKHFYEAFLKNITPLSLLNTVSNQLAKIQEEQSILSISEFNKLINEQIQNQPAPFIYERLGERYKHFFIDEFQDTSEMQWQNLVPLIDNALSSEDLQGNQGSLLIVGDPKQSIYRWRGGKAEQFIDLTKMKKYPFSNENFKVFNLESNYRSYDEVIHFNNDFFRFLAEKFENEDYKDLYLNKSYQRTNAKKGGFVNISFLSELEEADDEEITTNDLYLQKTGQTIQDILAKGFSLSDIVLLTRSNKHGVLLANYLTENKIPVISSESLLLDSSSEVQFVLDVLRYLNDKKDKESLAHLLYYLVKNYTIPVGVHNFISEGIQFEDEGEFRKWLKSYGVNLDFTYIRRKSLYEIAENIIMNGIPKDKNNAYVQFFLDVVLERDVKYQMSIGDFLEYWKKSGSKLSVPSAEGSDAIRIMTIHKSKGLEFPVVIFPFAEEDFTRTKGDKLWIQADEAEMGMSKALVAKNKDVQKFGEQANRVYNQKAQEDLLDNINVLYVALTRAEEQLYVISGYKQRNKEGKLPNNLASYFIEFVEDRIDFEAGKMNYDFGSPEKMSSGLKKTSYVESIKSLHSVIKPDSIKIAQREALMWGTSQQQAIEFGNMMHEILSFVRTKDDVGLAVAKALENGLISAHQENTVLEMLLKIVGHPELVDFFSAENKVFNERSILKKNVKMMIPDRVAIKGNEVYLLDYKTGMHQEKYVRQITEYEAVLEEMGLNVVKKTLLYIGEKLEVVNL
ncbi:UvrD-helicase domain-containing protein [Flavobacterium amniphilum]|uniref:UvrD-helicase domain-containing protein n=1 Tax=Flavobacterium amniphilum TaxID=1834035 RepID=UPI00202AAE23|nr:UvrD-helicase domain-containing protein [Flavobacterium amniphilum]MCL9805997.1 UvrD-helicase domain-containing protein [Flavobacterium amniphilum]